MRGMGGGGSDVAAATAAMLAEGVAEVGALPSDMSTADGSLLIEGTRASPVAVEGTTRSVALQPQPPKRWRLPWNAAPPTNPAVAEVAIEVRSMGAHGAEIDASVTGLSSDANSGSADPQGDGVELAMPEAISGVPNMATDAHSEENSAVADTSSEAWKLAMAAQPEENPR